ncbi:hypothetical protein PV779_42115 [Streptomyces sp. ID01-9D]|nr:hypothetical protein [Streptomyces sp. ID01-9D]
MGTMRPRPTLDRPGSGRYVRSADPRNQVPPLRQAPCGAEHRRVPAG